MRRMTVGWIEGRSARSASLACMVLILAALPFAVRAGEVTKHFDIRAQPLSEALMALGAQTGAIVMASSELTTGKTSSPVTGQLTVKEALTRMLMGTGLRFETSADGAILIARGAERNR